MLKRLTKQDTWETQLKVKTIEDLDSRLLGRIL